MIPILALVLALTGDISPEATAACETYVQRARVAYRTAAFADYKTSLVTQDVYNCRGDAQQQYRQPAARTVRWMHVEGTANFRDIGGWTGLKTGRVYRGAEANCQTNPACFDKDQTASHDLFATAKGLKTLSEEMKIRTDLDLRARKESPTPDASPIPGAQLVRIPLSSYTNGLQKGAALYAQALRVFADGKNYPIYFHCYGGADRTGTLALLVEGLCGVNEADCAVDYELTSFGLGERPRYNHWASYAGVVAMMKACPGATFQDQVTFFVEHTLGLTADEILAIRKNLTDMKRRDLK